MTKSAYAFGHTFEDLDGLIDNLITLEREGCLYNHFWDEISQTYRYIRIRLTPSEIYQYVEAQVAKGEFDSAIKAGVTFKKALRAIKNITIAKRVESFGDFGKLPMRDGTIQDIRGCFASFLPPFLDHLLLGQVHDRYENVFDIESFKKKDLLYQQLDQFPIVSKYISIRKHNRKNFEIQNEYDVQDLLFVCLKSVFKDVIQEEWTTKHGGKSKRIDLVVPEIKTVIEVKKVRNANHGLAISDELKIDIESYHIHPNCKTLICFIHDPNSFIFDRNIIETEISGIRIKKESKFEVKVFIR